MKARLYLVAFILFAVAFCVLLAWKSSAQTMWTGYQINSTLTVANCVAPMVGVTTYCFAGDGLWVSINGAAYLKLPPGVPASLTAKPQ